MSLAAAREKALEFADRLHEIGPISVTRFFGGAGLVRNGVQFAFVIEGLFYFRVDDLSRPDFEALGASPFTYATRSKMVKVASYYELPNRIAEDHDELIRWATRASKAATLAKSASRRKRLRSR
jgi:TfoX/Sxy family transcriptional regulator of competence genes